MAAAAILDNFEWSYLRNGSRSTYKRASRGHLCDSTAFLLALSVNISKTVADTAKVTISD